MQATRIQGRIARLWRNALLVGGGDLVVLAVGLLLGRAVVTVLAGGPLSLRFSLFLLPVWLLGASAIGLLPGWGLDTVEELRRIQMLLLALFALGSMAFLFGRGVFYPSRLAYAVSWFFSAAGIPLLRAGMKRLLHRVGAWGCPVVLYGDRAGLETMVSLLKAEPELGYQPVGVFSDDPEASAGLPRLGGLYDYSDTADVAIAPMQLMAHPSPAESFDRALAGYARVLLLPESAEEVFLWVRPRSLGGRIGMEVTSNLLNPASRAIKRSTDLALTVLAAPLWIPVLAILALAIWLLDRHSPLFLQERIGRGGRRFRTIKFRTMIKDADRALAEELDHHPELRREWDARNKLRNDPRVTRLGRFLRRWSLDELPQLIHVLDGRMSLIGPRPLPAEHEAKLRESARTLRRRVRPGLTGLWQISGRSESGTEGLSRWDAYYVRNWSIWLDLVILARTVRAVWTGQGAY
ncbi:MAG: exopolysaccharide biosynthesis polyprenyl glycosylphosphotransferase [Kiritimatiellia bacterium]|nr:exopolysaccharide biosynthesis polyprenyl glycosylphosphotransferase [Kiritimatiellia bacterium]